MKKKIEEKFTSGWGGYPRKLTKIYYPTDIKQILEELKCGELIARGNGRAYGEGIKPNKTINMKYFNKLYF